MSSLNDVHFVRERKHPWNFSPHMRGLIFFLECLTDVGIWIGINPKYLKKYIHGLAFQVDVFFVREW